MRSSDSPGPAPRPDPALLARGRDAYARRDWGAALDALGAADADAPLGADDLWRLGLAAYLTGAEPTFVGALERAHQCLADQREPLAAARAAFWLGLHMAGLGETGRAGGWFGRMRRLVEAHEADCVERGYVLVPEAHQRLASGDPDGAAVLAARAVGIAYAFGDRDLAALALHIEGRARLRQGRVREGLALLDETMVAVAGDELAPHLTGLLYCSVVAACREVHALGRAQEWTEALAAWCERQPDMVAYTGECRIYRSEILRLHGDWTEALGELQQALTRTGGGADAATVSLAHYQAGEVHRLRGELAAAERAYRDASAAGREPLPGLALLRLAQGDAAAAAATTRRALAETTERWRRARLLPAHIEALLAIGDPGAAAEACVELEAIAALCPGGGLDPVVAYCRGAIRLAVDDPTAALPALRAAARRWRELDAPYEAARARELLGEACRALGDGEAAALELDAARATYRALGAATDLARLDGAGGGGRRRADDSARRHGLTPRELEVLRLVATGKTNRAVAEQLFISERTVARHVANIFMKLGLSSRAAATAYAYEHDLVDRSA